MPPAGSTSVPRGVLLGAVGANVEAENFYDWHHSGAVGTAEASDGSGCGVRCLG
jgi:hypothetical protein